MSREQPQAQSGRPHVCGTWPRALGLRGASLLAVLTCFAPWGAQGAEILVGGPGVAPRARPAGVPPSTDPLPPGPALATPGGPGVTGVDSAVAPPADPNAKSAAPLPAEDGSNFGAPTPGLTLAHAGVLSSTQWGGRGIARVASAYPLTRGAFTLTARVAYFRAPRLFAGGAADKGSEQEVHVAFSPLTGLELALSQTSIVNDYATRPARSLQLQGNPTLRVKYGRHVRGPWALGVLGRVTLPTVQHGAGASLRAALPSGTALVSLQPIERLEVVANFGYGWAKSRHALRNEVPDVVERFVFGIDATPSAHWGVGVVGRTTVAHRLDLLPYAEIMGHVGTSKSSSTRVNPIQVSVGLRGYPTRSRAVEIALGSDVRVAGGPRPNSPFAGLPPWRAFGQVTVHLGEGTARRRHPHDDDDRISFRVRGVALDANSGAPVLGAAVHVAGDEALLLFAADEQTGRFVSAPQSGGRGTLHLVAQAPGYLPAELAVPRSRDGRDVDVTVRLQAEPRGQKLALLKGSLKDAVSGTPVVGAELVLPALGRTLRTDATGSFAALVKPGRYTAVLRAPGYTAQRKFLVLRAGESMVLHVDMQAAP